MPFDYVGSADWHIGASRRLQGYLERQSDMLDAIANIAKTKTSSGVVFASADLLDRENVLAKERDLLVSKLLKFDADGLTFVIIDGNHDRLSTTHSNLSLLKIMADFGAFKRLKIAVIHPERFEVFGHDVLAVPWTGEPTEKRYNRRVLNCLKTLGCNKPILLTHEQFRGCADDSGHFTEDGPLPKAELMENVHVLIAGHIHKHQRITERAFYTGSPMQKTFGETPKKGVLVFNHDKPDEPEFVRIKSVKKMVTLTEIPENNEWPDAYIKLKLPAGTSVDNLPASVVYNTYTSAEDDTETTCKVDLSNPLDGMYEALVHSGLTKRQAKKGLVIAESLYARTRGAH